MTEIRFKFIIEHTGSEHFDIKESSFKSVKELSVVSFSESSFTPYFGVITLSAYDVTEADLQDKIIKFFHNYGMRIIIADVWSRDSYYYTLGFDDGFFGKSDYSQNDEFYISGLNYGKTCRELSATKIATETKTII